MSFISRSQSLLLRCKPGDRIALSSGVVREVVYRTAPSTPLLRYLGRHGLLFECKRSAGGYVLLIVL